MNEVEERALDRDSGPEDEGRLGRIVRRCEEIFFALLLFGFLAAGLTPIVLRYLEVSSAAWASPLSQHLVLWVALFGAGAATRDRKHITIDAVSQFLPERGRLGLRAATGLFAAIVCGVMAWVSVGFVRDEIEFAGGEISPLGVPTGWLPAVIPLGFSVLTLRFLAAIWIDSRAAFHGQRRYEEKDREVET